MSWSVASASSGSWVGLSPIPTRHLTASRRQGAKGLRFSYRLTEALDWDWVDRSPHVQDWHVVTHHGDEFVALIRVIRADVMTPDGYDMTEALDAIDGETGTLAAMATEVIECVAQPYLDLMATCNRGDGGSNILLLESWEIAADWDGYHLLDLIIAQVLSRLCESTAFLVAEPAPIGMRGRKRHAFRDRFEPVLSRLGFSKFKYGRVWINDLSSSHLDDELARLQRRFGVAREIPADAAGDEWLTSV